MNRVLKLAVATAALLGTPLAHASGAHEHGVSHLDVILDGAVLAIDFRGAGYHLAGFEHAPDTEDQHAAWQAARDGLADAEALFKLPREANCSLLSAEVTAPASAADPSHGHATADAHRHGHAGHHDPGHRHDGGEHDHGHGDDRGHAADWQARYRFECADADRLTAIEVGLFAAFPAHEEVRFQRFSDGGQGGGTLTPGRTRLELR